ncbi:MAG: HlyD family efflux transporter periplasmic adaptor subunit [Aestuariivita sp.]|nr:HlyD family efflux transporter periplasmic adaptor subunit [Aestuariivita sp.]
MRFLRQSLTGVFLTALTFGLLVLAGNMIRSAVEQRLDSNSVAPPARERIFAVNVIRANAGAEIPQLEAFGEVQSRRTLELRAAAGGRIIELASEFTEGGVVRSGQLLFRVDPAERQAQLDRDRSNLLDAQAEVRDAKRSLILARDELVAAETQAAVRERTLRRQEDLQRRDVGSAAAVESAELALAQARQSVLSRHISVSQREARIDQAATKLNRAQILLSESERDLADTQAFAAFDGTLNNVKLVEGRLVSPNEKLAELIDPNELEVAFRVSTRQYVRLLDDDGALIPAQVNVTLDGAGAELTTSGTVSRDSVGVGAVRTGRLLYASLINTRGFKPGDFVTVSVREPVVENVVRLPASAYDSNGTVLVVDDTDRLESLIVDLVRRQRDSVLVRADGLAGRDVVQARTPLLGAGIRVKPIRPGPQAEEVPTMLELGEERRARLVAFVEGNARIPAEAKARILNQLANERVSRQMVERLESRMGG